MVVNNHSGTPLFCQTRGHWYVLFGIRLSCLVLSHRLSLLTNSPFSSLLSSILSEFIFCLTMPVHLPFSLFRKQMYGFHPHRESATFAGSPSHISFPTPAAILHLHSPQSGGKCGPVRGGCVVVPRSVMPLEENYTAAWLEHGY